MAGLLDRDWIVGNTGLAFLKARLSALIGVMSECLLFSVHSPFRAGRRLLRDDDALSNGLRDGLGDSLRDGLGF